MASVYKPAGCNKYRIEVKGETSTPRTVAERIDAGRPLLFPSQIAACFLTADAAGQPPAWLRTTSASSSLPRS